MKLKSLRGFSESLNLCILVHSIMYFEPARIDKISSEEPVELLLFYPASAMGVVLSVFLILPPISAGIIAMAFMIANAK